jgi:hypothetical protein
MNADIRLPGSDYEELCNIIVAYGTRDEASNPGDVGKLDTAHQGSVSRNNAFLTDIGILKGGREKLVTGEGRKLAEALSRQDKAQVSRSWRELASRNEFLQNVLSAVKMREVITRDALRGYIAHSAGQPKNKPVMAGASAIIDILKVAGLLGEDVGELTAATTRTPDQSVEPEVELSTSAGGQEIRLHLHVRCSPDELDELAPRIKKLIAELSDE